MPIAASEKIERIFVGAAALVNSDSDDQNQFSSPWLCIGLFQRLPQAIASAPPSLLACFVFVRALQMLRSHLQNMRGKPESLASFSAATQPGRVLFPFSSR